MTPAPTIRQTETLPDKWPHVPGVPAMAGTLERAVWQRIEGYVAHRFALRPVVWIAEGPGEWIPPLTPATVTTVEKWDCTTSAWLAATLSPSPSGGYLLQSYAQYRFTGTAGNADIYATSLIPDGVQEAYRRLARYMMTDPGRPGASREVQSIDVLRREIERDPAHMAKALQNSGAADLLRSYRRI